MYLLNFMHLGGKTIIIVKYYLNSGHCKKLAPEFSSAAEILAKNEPPVMLAKVDATE